MGPSRAGPTILFGGKGAISGAKAAAITQNTTKLSPKAAEGVLMARLSAANNAYAAPRRKGLLPAGADEPRVMRRPSGRGD